MIPVPGGPSLYSKFYFRLKYYLRPRTYVQESRRILRAAQVLRSYFILGPLRTSLIGFQKTFRTNEPFTTDYTSIFSRNAPDEIVERIEKSGYAHVGKLPEMYVEQILEYCRVGKRVEYWNPHKDCEAVNRISRDKGIVEIARRYLGVEPILWLTQLKWSGTEVNSDPDVLPSAHVADRQYKLHAFHYDTNDIKSLTLFIYLTDVDIENCPHLVIEGTHKRTTLKDLSVMVMDDETAYEKFGDRIKVILGAKGTAFLEDTTVFHKVAPGGKRRLMLSIDYAFSRNPPQRPERSTE